MKEKLEIIERICHLDFCKVFMSLSQVSSGCEKVLYTIKLLVYLNHLLFLVGICSIFILFCSIPSNRALEQ